MYSFRYKLIFAINLFSENGGILSLARAGVEALYATYAYITIEDGCICLLPGGRKLHCNQTSSCRTLS